MPGLNKVKKTGQVIRYVNHGLTARNSGGHGVHSPFMFNFIRYVLMERLPYYLFEDIEQLREELKNDQRIFVHEDFGREVPHKRRVCDMARNTLQPARQAQLLFRMAHYFNCRKIVELGTALGVSTLYLAGASSKIRCMSFEGCPQLSALAKENFQKMGFSNIELITGNINETLLPALENSGKQDLYFIDANHRLKPTLQYFENCLNFSHDNTIIVLDDINWSDEMQQAWQTIKVHPAVRSTIDIYHLGIVFLNPMLTAKHYKMRF